MSIIPHFNNLYIYDWSNILAGKIPAEPREKWRQSVGCCGLFWVCLHQKAFVIWIWTEDCPTTKGNYILVIQSAGISQLLVSFRKIFIALPTCKLFTFVSQFQDSVPPGCQDTRMTVLQKTTLSLSTKIQPRCWTVNLFVQTSIRIPAVFKPCAKL